MIGEKIDSSVGAFWIMMALVTGTVVLLYVIDLV